MSASEVTHVAREVGQLTLFGGADDDGAEELLASLPAAAKANPKEALDWEKELVGVYVSSHPLQQMTVDLMNVITHASVDVTEEVAGKGVVVAGIVADVRQITTKKGETMAFVRLEDLQGTIDITVFPRLYTDEKDKFALEKIIIVTGKADVRNGRVSVVADFVRDYVEGMKVIEDTSSVAYRFRNGAAGMPSRPQVKERPTAQSYAAPARAYPPPPSMAGGDDDEDAYSGDDNPFAAEEPAWMDEGEMGSGGRRGAEGERGAGDKETRRREHRWGLPQQALQSEPPARATRRRASVQPQSRPRTCSAAIATPKPVDVRAASPPAAPARPQPASAIRNPSASPSAAAPAWTPTASAWPRSWMCCRSTRATTASKSPWRPTAQPAGSSTSRTIGRGCARNSRRS